MLQLQEELSATENKIAFARQFYNDLVMRYNTAQETFPTRMIAGAFGFAPGEFFEATAAERELPAVDLSLR
ncbi:LemA family protein [compost metagenome]